ncbi:S9 family peptidase [Planctobacterium marinum]|uniref:Peptidase S9 n=1 Tax=Planctobacterium marinum TaxID=1631968 RepID=A0AA48HKR1_9ALTE|nr:peptidase S9 [Planctobacterium marinum]
MSQYFKEHLKVALLFLFSSIASTAGAATGSMSPELLVALKQINDARLSPDNKRIAFIQNIPRDTRKASVGPDWQELFLLDHKGQMRHLIRGLNQIQQIKWSGDGQQIWLLMRRQIEPFFSIYMIRPDGGEAIKVVARKQHIHGFDLHNDGQSLAYWYPSEQAEQSKTPKLDSVYEFENEPDKNHRLYLLSLAQMDKGEQLIPVDGHVVEAKFAPESQQLLIKKAPSKNQDDIIMRAEYVLSDGISTTTTLVSGLGKLGKAAFSPDGNKLAFIAAQTPSSPDHGSLFLMDIKRQKSQQILSNFEGMITNVLWPETRNLVFSADIGVRSIIASKRANHSSDSYRTLYDGQLIIRGIHSTDSDNNLAVIANSRAHPDELFWFKRGKMLRSSNSNSQLDELNLGLQQVHKFKAEDGVELEGILISPRDANTSARYDTVIFVHGGPESHISDGWIARYSQPVHSLAAMGIQSFLPNYRGSSGRGDAFLKLSQGDYAGAEFNDLLVARQYLLDKQLATDWLGISGASYGGYAAAWCATKFSQYFSAAVSIAGISNQTSKFGTTDIPTEMLQTHALSMPWQSWQKWLQASPIYYSEKHKTPLLIMHGMKDNRVHYSQSLELYRHLKTRNNAPVSLLLYPEQGHHIIDAHTQLDIAERVTRWLDTYRLKASDSPD